jgi:hypothetical protein
MIGRLWYPQLDIYDAIRRMAGLLSIWNPESAPSPERLYVADFYLANAPLLHRTHMTLETRKRFNSLGIPNPEKSFVSYPSPPVLFQKMSEVQREAIRTLSGKGLVELDALERGVVEPSSLGRVIFPGEFLPLFNEREKILAEFLASSFSESSQDIATLRRNTGLRRVGR